MSINVKTENVTDATVQVHIAFENERFNRRKSKKPRATRIYNRAVLRDADPLTLTTGRNTAEHQFSAKAEKRDPKMISYAQPSLARPRPATPGPA